MGHDEEGAYSDDEMVDSEERRNDGELLSGSRDKESSRKHSSIGSKDRKKADRDRSRERGKDDSLEENPRDRSERHHRDKERSRGKTSARDKDRGKDREDRDRDRGGRDSHRERDHERRDRDPPERERTREKDRERGKDRERLKDREDKHKDRDKEHDRHKDNKGSRTRERESESGADRDRRTRDREADRSRGRGKEKDEREKRDALDDDVAAKRAGGEVEGDGDKLERSSKEHDDKPAGSLSTSELGERVIKMRQERLKQKSDGASEIASWVSKSRRLVDNMSVEKEKAARTSRQLEEQDNIEEESDDEKDATHSGNDLAGVKILHGLDKVIEGGAVVLTLKDQAILADGDINEEMDMLENVEIGEQKQRDEAYKASKKRAGVYEDKFSDDYASQKTILPQYDDPVEDEGITLDESGRFTGEAEKKLEELRRRIEGGSIKRTYEDLASSGTNSSDYYTPDEMLQFKKPRKKKSLRKRDKLDLDALEAEAISAGLGAGDLGSRDNSRRQSAKEQEAKAEADMRSSAYQSALAKAEEASKVLRQEQTLTVMPVEDDNMVFGEDYEDLEKSLEQARKLSLKRKEESAASGPQAVALMAIANKEREDTQNSTTVEPQENKVVITEMEEFVLGLQFNEETQKPDSEDVFKDDADIPTSIQHEMKPEIGGWTEIKETLKDEQPVSEEEDITPDEIIHESAVGKGLSGALKLLKERGTLKEGIDWGGRNMDKKKSKLVGINDSGGSKEIRIERTDEFGRIMTPKEAFRVISHKFHGKGPGKMKQEKRMKQYQEDLKTKQMKASDTPSLAMQRMREVQAQSKMPYLVISGHVKPGQTSDPRSGFATVEKDHLGSLTPMLGDKKVEHFLGINRKPDKGSMGPPPPRKPSTKVIKQ